ncbi:hypothetical protein BMS3Abin06_02129 [bacterium BMS3Abin06]|nr:hypothetical protein BMS3Abin06_02129 [bacterium BMS3Abin06]
MQHYNLQLCIDEQESLRELHGLRIKNEIIDAIKEETGKCLDEIKKSKGIDRNILMDLLYRAGRPAPGIRPLFGWVSC